MKINLLNSYKKAAEGVPMEDRPKAVAAAITTYAVVGVGLFVFELLRPNGILSILKEEE